MASYPDTFPAKDKPLKPSIKPGDFHLIVNDVETRFNSEAKLYDSTGKLLWTKDALAKGAGGKDYSKRNSDTPPGLYRIGELTVTNPKESDVIWNAFGKYFFDLVGLQENEERFGRSGIGIHGGGTGAAPNSLAAYQQLVVTHGCIRMYNKDVETEILPRWKSCRDNKTAFYVSVNQF